MQQMTRKDVTKDSQRGHGEVREEDGKRRKGVGRGQLMRKRQRVGDKDSEDEMDAGFVMAGDQPDFCVLPVRPRQHFCCELMIRFDGHYFKVCRSGSGGLRWNCDLHFHPARII